MTADPPSWAVRLREERCKRGWSQRQMAVRIYRAADERIQAGLPRVEYIVRRIVGYEGGVHRPRDPYVELYSRAFGIPRDVLFGPGRGEQPDRLPVAADGDRLVTWISSSNTTDEAIDRIGQIVLALAGVHARQPPRHVLEDLMQAHRQVQELLHGGRQRLRQTRDLLRIDADLLAHASLLLDDIRHSASAKAHGRAALLFATGTSRSRRTWLARASRAAIQRIPSGFCWPTRRQAPPHCSATHRRPGKHSNVPSRQRTPRQPPSKRRRGRALARGWPCTHCRSRCACVIRMRRCGAPQ